MTGFVPDPAWPSISELAAEIWGEPNKALSSRDDVRFGAKGSKSVKPSSNTWRDHETGDGGGYIDLHVKARGEPPKRAKGNGHLPPWEDIAVTYPYHGADGALSFEVVRTISGNPRFRQRRPLRGDRWTWSIKDAIPPADRPPYRLPELVAAPPDSIVFVPEGEKDVDNLQRLGLIATCNVGGAGRWHETLNEYLRNRDVVVLPDNDQPGQDHADRVARNLLGVAASVKVLRLPGLPDKGDVSDWLAAGGTIEDLLRLTGEAPAFQAQRGLLTVLTPDDCEAVTPRPYVLKGLIGRGDSILLIGQPGAGKSVVGPYIGYAVAQGRSVFNRRVHQGVVLYIATEDGHGMKLRVRALRRRWGDTPDFYLVPDALDLKDPNSQYLVALRELVQRLKPSLIIIDTLARAFPGLKENEPDAPDGMGRVVMVVRELAMICEAAVMTLHHMPKDGATPRGHGALNGDADVTLVVEGAATQPRLVRLMKNRNGASDATLTFSVRSEPLGVDEDGDIITAAIAEETEPTATDGLRAKEAKLRDKPAFMLRELRNLTISQAEPLSLGPDGPLVSAVRRRSLREALIKSGWFPENLLRTASNGTVELDRAGYPSENHALDSLKRVGFLAFSREWVWLL
jgi:hypothetical protein